MTVSIIKDGYECLDVHYLTITEALSRIKNGKSRFLVEQIRKGLKEGLSGVEIKRLKASLPSVLFHGKFDKVVEAVSKTGKPYKTKKVDESLTEHSGLLVLDFDEVSHVKTKIMQLQQDPYIFAAWVSPSGNGVKALVKCTPSIEKHHDLYTAFIERYPELDTTSKSLSRLCYESYDPDLYYNPNATVWTKTITEKAKEELRKKREKYKSNKPLEIAMGMIRNARDGEKHLEVLKAGRLVGGYIKTGSLNQAEVISLVNIEIESRESIEDKQAAKDTFLSGIEYGKAAPLYEAKKIEKAQDFVIREDGTFDFTASEEEMDFYENAYLDGTLEMGYSIGFKEVDEHFMVKRNTLVFFAGADNTGKSFWGWYIAVMMAMLNDWKIIIHSAENNDGQVRRKIKEFYIGKELKQFSKEELEISKAWFKKHFIIMTSRKSHTWEDLLMKMEVVYDEGFKFDLAIAEPFNAMDIPDGLDSHRHNLKALNLMRVFKENYASLYVFDHINSNAARNKKDGGGIETPTKADVDGGQIKANKVDDFGIIHRDTKGADWRFLQLNIDKVKDVETGGKPTQRGEPIMILMNSNKCGYTINGYDAVKEYWKTKLNTNEKITTRNDNFLGENTEEEESPLF